MGNPGLCVEYVDVQKNVKNLQGRSVILNAFCKDSKGTQIDIEVQKANDDAYDDEQFPKTSERKRWFKKNPKGEEEMCDIVREIAEAERAEGIKEGIKEGKQAFVSTLKELGVTYSDTLCKLKEKFQLDELILCQDLVQIKMRSSAS